jgi:competence protein ComEA
MSQPPPFLLPPDGPRSRARALLAGAGRQRVAVALLVVAALLVAGVVWVRATPRQLSPAVGQGVATGGPAASGDQGPAAPADQTLPRAAPGTSAPSGAPGRVAVHVAGRVRHPGLVRPPAGSRVQDTMQFQDISEHCRLALVHSVLIPHVPRHWVASGRASLRSLRSDSW